MNDFSKRFGLEVDMAEARERFINRVCNDIFDEWDNRYSNQHPEVVRSILTPIASELGKRYYRSYNSICDYVNTKDYLEVLRGVEAIYKKGSNDDMKLMIDVDMNDHIISKSELDLGIRWENGKFLPTGAKLLDDKLVNDPLKWLRTNEYLTVVEPLEKALRHFLEAESRPELLSDVIGNSYKAIEALAKIVVGNNSGLSTNKKALVKKLNGNNFHEQIFKVLEKYLDAGNPYRHGENLEKPLPPLTHAETEFFVYLTGIFLRLAMENWDGS